MMKWISLIVLMTGAWAGAAPQPPKGRPIEIPARTPGMEWFEDAKLGIFLHWGIYSVGQTGESHPINSPNPRPTPDQYYAQAKGFTAQNYDPSRWADIFLRAGARYAILTTKHHDGFALFDSDAPQALDAADDSAAGRDLIAPYVKAMRDAGIRPGFYSTPLNDFVDIMMHIQYVSMHENDHKYSGFAAGCGSQ